MGGWSFFIMGLEIMFYDGVMVGVCFIGRKIFGPCWMGFGVAWRWCWVIF